MKKKIIRIMKLAKNKTTIKIVAVILIVGTSFVLNTFAADAGLSTFNEFLNKFISMASWLRIWLAVIAGKLMTNDLVYGSFMNLDIYLWKIWNIIKNFANFALIALVLYKVLQNVIGKDKENPKTLIGKTLIAGILINASWFIVGMLVDISTIGISTVASFPMTFIQNSTEIKNTLIEGNGDIQKYDYLIDNGQIVTIKNTTIKYDDFLKNMMPKYDSVSGPLILLGFNVFRFQDFMTIKDGANPDIRNMTIDFLLKTFIIILFTVALLLLIIANIIRIGLLWCFIMIGPILVLTEVLKKGGGDSKGFLGETFNFKALINTVFKPIVYVVSLSLMLIFSLIIKGVLSGSQTTDINGVNFSLIGNESSINVEGISNTKLMTNVVEKGQSAFADLIVMCLTLFIMWSLVMFTLKGSGPINKAMDAIGLDKKTLEKLVKNIPLFTGPDGEKYGADQFRKSKQAIINKTLEGVGIEKGRDGRSWSEDRKGQEQLSGLIAGTGNWNKKYENDLYMSINSNKPDKFFEESLTISNALRNGISLQDGKRSDYLEQWMTKYIGTNGDIIGGDSSWAKDDYKFTGPYTKETAKDFWTINNKQNVKTLHKIMKNKFGFKSKYPDSNINNTYGGNK
ncbi:MAG: hypothetical protein WC872_00810 [Candidatus Absconditabacterales bacterium]